MPPEIQVYDDAAGLASAAAGLFAAITGEAIDGSGRAGVALSGGRTPLALYRLLAEGFKDRLDWTRVDLFWGDERCVAPDAPESNYGAARPFIEALGVPPANIHRIRGEEGAEAAASGYAEELRRHFSLSEGEPPAFDLMLLGLGADGHIASLFPGTGAVDEEHRVAAPVYVKGLSTGRVTLTPPVVRRARNIMVLVSGPEKAEAFREAVADEPAGTGRKPPSRILRSCAGRVLWLTDRAAAGGQ